MGHSPGLGVVTIDRAFTIQSWNQWLADATGLAEGDARGRSLLSVVAEDRVDVLRGLLDEVLSSGTSRVLAPAFHRRVIKCPPREPSRHFSEMQQLVTIAPLRSDTRIAGAMITIEDVTARLDHERTLTAAISSAPAGVAPVGALEAVGAADWRLRGAAVRALQQTASREEIAHLLEALQRGYHDFNVVSSALEVLAAANLDVTSPLIDLLGDAHPDLRMHAALALGKVGDHAAVPALVRALDDQDANVRFHAIEALGSLGVGDAVDPLAAIARSGDFFLSFAAIAALAKTDDPRVGPALTALLDNALLRPAVIDTLAAVGDEDCVAPLVGVLDAEDGDAGAVAAALDSVRGRYEDTFAAGAHIVDLVRGALTPAGIARVAAAVEQRQAPLAPLVTLLGWTGDGLAALLGVLGDPAVETPLADAIAGFGRDAVGPLNERLLNADRSARIAAASLLGRLGDRRAVAPLVDALGDLDAELSTAAAAALARLGDASALDALLPLFAHPHAMVRQAAMAAINSIGAEATAARILPRLSDADARVRSCSIRVAGYFGFDECIPGMFRALEDPDEEVRRAAIEQLPVVDDPRAVPRLLDALRTETPRNRAAAAHALRSVEAADVTSPLVDALDDADPWVRYFAAGSVGHRKDFAAAGRLVRIAEGDQAPHARIAAIQALTAIDPGMAGAVSVALVHDADREVACAALGALAASPSADADDLLEAAVRSADESLRRGAVQALGSRLAARAAEVLAWSARLADPPDLARLAVESLGRIGAGPDRHARKAALDALLDLGSAGEIRETMIATLAALPPDAVDDLAAALSSPRAVVRGTVVEALARMRHPRASEAMSAALADPDAAVRRAAVAAFGRLGTSAVAPTIAALRERDPDPGVRRLASAISRRHGWVSLAPGAPR